jgi:sortase (surface protein transpeptidase)
VPGEQGTAVIAGHVDSRTQGRGAFWPLRELRPGDVIEVVHEDGTSTRWRVDEVVRYPKTDIPIEDIFTFDGDERLALITCGGEFDRSAGAYLDNYVVMASPLVLPFGPGTQPLPASP